MSSQPLYAQAKFDLSPERLDKEVELFPAWEVVWQRMLCLASLARTIDPTLPPYLRFVKKAPLDPNQRNNVDFEIIMSHEAGGPSDYSLDTYERLKSLSLDRADVSLASALRRVLPSEVVDHELKLIQHAPSHGLLSGSAYAIQEAFLQGYISLSSKPIEEKNDQGQSEKTDQVWVSSGAVKVSEFAFLEHATVARWAWMSPTFKHELPKKDLTSAAEVSPSIKAIREDVLALRDLLKKPFKITTGEEKKIVVESIRRLNQHKSLRPSFEEAFDHSWVGYALAHRNGEGWTSFLIDEAKCKPTATYAEQTPAVIAIGQDDGKSLGVLLEKKMVVPNAFMSDFPHLFTSKVQSELNSRNERHISLYMFATLLEAKESMKTLFKYGADPDLSTDQGAFPLMEAAYRSKTDLVRLLLSHGANPLKENHNGDTAELFVDPSDDVTYNIIKKAQEEERDRDRKAAEEQTNQANLTIDQHISSALIQKVDESLEARRLLGKESSEVLRDPLFTPVAKEIKAPSKK